MAIPPFPQRKEADLLAWSAAFSQKISLAPTTYGLSVGQASAYAALDAAFAAAYATAVSTGSNSHAAIVAKNTAEFNLVKGPGGARELVDIIQEFPGTTDVMRADLNIRIHDTQPTPIPPPTESPDLDIVSPFGHTVKIRIHGARSIGFGKPVGVKGASIFRYIGENAPNSVEGWTFAGNTTKTVYEVTLPAETPAGSKVWITAYWFNGKMQSGPAATPVSIHIPGGLSVAA